MGGGCSDISVGRCDAKASLWFQNSDRRRFFKFGNFSSVKGFGKAFLGVWSNFLSRKGTFGGLRAGPLHFFGFQL